MMAEPAHYAIEAQNLSKSYGATVALENVSLSIRPGEVQALLGENGAGKSTLVKIISGVVHPNGGDMRLDGAVYTPKNIVMARKLGVTTAFQEISLVPNLTVAQNFFLPTALKKMGGIASMRRMVDCARAIMEEYDIATISPNAHVQSLTLAERQRLEIVRAARLKPQVLVLDEPSAALPDVDWLYRLVRHERGKGTAILYISHRLAEIRELAQRATILRSGRSVATVDLKDATDNNIFELMVGHQHVAQSRQAASRPVARAAKLALTVNDLDGPNVDGASLQVHEGEIVGVAGLDGQGQRELFRILAGDIKRTGGQVVLNDRLVAFSTPRQALQTAGGLAFVPEERKTEGIFPNLASTGNISICALSRLGTAGLISSSRESAAVRAPAESVELSDRYLKFKIGSLSGGNQQKALIARVLLSGAKTLLLFDPTRGVDVGTKEAIYRAIRSHADNGGSVLVYSSELPELLAISDRCLVMYRSRIVAEGSVETFTESSLVALMTGHDHQSQNMH